LFSNLGGRAPVLVIGVGNVLLKDDGAGIELVNRLSAQSNEWGNAVDFLEGGTLGLALLPYLSGRRAIIVLDAVALGAKPGTLHELENDDILALGLHSSSAHEGNAAELLRTARLLGDLPESLSLIGIEPRTIGTGMRFSKQVRAAIPAALQRAGMKINNILAGLCNR
jgi:hydrogenase maturation protease